MTNLVKKHPDKELTADAYSVAFMVTQDEERNEKGEVTKQRAVSYVIDTDNVESRALVGIPPKDDETQP